MPDSHTTKFGPDILTSDHMRGCQGREYQCTCGYDDAKDEVIERLRRALLFDCMHFGHSEAEAAKIVSNVEAGIDG
jgi:hypothetical protein